MRLCIDGSNLRAGGGVTHLRELLRHGTPAAHGFNEVVVWASKATLEQLEPRPWLHMKSAAALEKNYLVRALWQRFTLGRVARGDGCDLLFVPGGSFATSFRPVVTMSRNMLPFEPTESARYGMATYRLKLLLLRWSQGRSLQLADGRIFLTEYARQAIEQVEGPFTGHTVTIPHGVDERFVCPPRTQRNLGQCSEMAPFRLIYVSTIDVYKHQDRVVEAVAHLHAEGRPVALDLIGGAHPLALPALRAALARCDPEGRFLRYHGALPYEKLNRYYAQADAAVFASTCENMPNALLEMMASSLPLACSSRRPMPEILGDAGLYFDPESVEQIADALRRLLDDHAWRTLASVAAGARARAFSWARCATDTFDFLQRVATAWTMSSGEDESSR